MKGESKMQNNFNQFSGGFQNNFNGQSNGFPQQNFNGQPNFQNQQNFGGQPNNNNTNKGSYSNFAEITVLAYLTRDPESTPMNNGSKVATADVAINHTNGETDFWQIECWASSPENSREHNFLMEHCRKGRQVFIIGTPYLKRKKRQLNGQDVLDQNGKAIYDSYPSIRVRKLIGVGGNGNGNSQSSNNTQSNNLNNQSNFQSQPQPNGFQPNGAQVGGFPNQSQFNQPNFGTPPQNGSFGAPQVGAV